MTEKKTIPYGAGLSVILLFLGIFHPPQIEASKENGITVSLIQSEQCNLVAYQNLTESVLSRNPDIIVWPEHSLPYDVRQDPKQNIEILKNISRESGALLIVGTHTKISAKPRDWYNTALAVDNGEIAGEYYKIQPVHFFNDGVPGNSFEPMETEKGIFAAPICFDCDYTSIARHMVMAGAEFFIVPSFDARSWSRIQHLQHAELFRMRAAETGRWIAVAASSGVSQIIDPHGNTHQKLDTLDKGVITGNIAPRQVLTFYTRFGWLLPWLCICYSYIYPFIFFFKQKNLSQG